MSDRTTGALARGLVVAAVCLLAPAALAGLLMAQVIRRGLHPYLEQVSLAALGPWFIAGALAALPIALAAGLLAAVVRGRRGLALAAGGGFVLLTLGFLGLRDAADARSATDRPPSDATTLEPGEAAAAALAVYPAWQEVGDAIDASSDPDRVNVVVITIDALRWDRLGFAGHDRPTSPQIDALAARGTIFEHGLAQAPATRASMASMLAGLYPHVLEIERGQRGGGAFVADGFHLLAERLAAAGYATAGVITNPYLRATNGFGQGFEFFDESTVFGHDRVGRTRNAAEATDVALRWLRRRVDDRPFFLWLHLLDPHHPYEPAEAAPWEPIDTAPWQALDAEYRALSVANQTARFEALADGSRTLQPGELDYLLGRYDAEIRFTDLQIGRLLNGLEAADATLENTLVLLTADHGEEFLDHGGMLHSHTLYDELIRVPFIAAGPGFAAGARIEGQARLIDVPPTALWAAGVRRKNAFAGLAGTPLQTSKRVEAQEGLSFLSLVEVAYRTPEAKMIGPISQAYDRLCLSDGVTPVSDLVELFAVRYGPPPRPLSDYELGRTLDLTRDPRESAAVEDPAVLHRLRCRSSASLAAHRPVRVTSEGGAKGLSEEDLQRLRALGYAE
ncbi:MAG: sulfatase [Acidobacteriota bacterium]